MLEKFFAPENSGLYAGIWDSYMYIGTAVFMAITFLIFLYHEIKVMTMKDNKVRYDYVTHYEIRTFMLSGVTAIIAAALISNAFMSNWVFLNGWKWFVGRVFLTICLAVLTYYLFFSMIRIYYVRYMERKLDRLRNKPRISPQGNEMRKLSESEEDAHLEASQIAEEGSEVHSVDYDVWLDDKTGYKKIEKYYSWQHAMECPDCGYVTLRIDHEAITIKPTETEPGELTKHYNCTFCNYKVRKPVPLAKLSDNVA